MSFSQLETISASMSPPPIHHTPHMFVNLESQLPPRMPPPPVVSNTAGRPQTPDIIDVDLLEDVSLQTSSIQRSPRTENAPRRVNTRRRPPARASPQPIYTISSGEEDDRPVASGSGLSSADPPNVPDIIRPNMQPFPFEEALEAPRFTSHPLPRIQPAPRSHHAPSMGLGGGLISQHVNLDRNHASGSRHRPLPPRGGPRLRDEDEIANHRDLPLMRRVWDAVNPFARLQAQQPERPRSTRFHRPFMLPTVDSDNEEEDMFLQNLLENDRNEDYLAGGRFENPGRPYARNEMLLLYGTDPERREYFDDLYNRRRPQPAAEPDYKPHYTHPYPADGKFSFDFAPEPLDGSSEQHAIILDDAQTTESPSAVSSTLLVCAKCQDPLLLSGSEESNKSDKKVWALQCGHLIDGKCANSLMRPTSPAEDIPSAVVDRKGKGKAKTILPDPESSDQDDDDYDTAPQSSSILSRLRSSDKRKRSQVPQTPRKRTKLSRSHQRQHRWVCPVNECGRQHISVRQRSKKGEWGEWEAEKGLLARGPIALFV